MILTVDGQDISEIVEGVRLSDNLKQVSRRLEFTAVHDAFDRRLPTAALPLGAVVLFAPGDIYSPSDPGSYLGTIWTSDKGTAEKKAAFGCNDLLTYLLKSDVNRAFNGTPEQIAQMICAEVDIPFGGAADTGIQTYFLAKQRSAYQALMMAYTAAARQNGKKYLPIMRGRELYVIEKGAQLAGVLLDSDYNITDASYKQSLEELVTQVHITNQDGAQVDIVEDAALRGRFGIVRRTVQQQDGHDDRAEAQKLLKGIKQTFSIKGPDVPACRAGYAVAIRESVTGLYGLFHIESSTHEYRDAAPEMSLTVTFENVMDEYDLET